MKFLATLFTGLFMINTSIAASSIWLIGDSTVSNYKKNQYPLTGWGQVLNKYCNKEIKVRNYAVGGRSTKSFLDEGRWDKVIKNIQSGDYLFIQFGHNDQKDYKKKVYAPANGLYKELLTKYINETKAKGAKPILVTSVCRLLVKNGEVYNSLGDYPAAMKEVAKSTGTPVIDLNAISLNKFNELGHEKSKELFLFFPPGTHKAYPKGSKDSSHFSEYGASQVASWVVTDAKKQKLDVTKLFK